MLLCFSLTNIICFFPVSFSYNLICVNKDAKAYPEVNDVKSRVAVQKSQRGSICSPPIYTHVSFFEKRPNC